MDRRGGKDGRGRGGRPRTASHAHLAVYDDDILDRVGLHEYLDQGVNVIILEGLLRRHGNLDIRDRVPLLSEHHVNESTPAKKVKKEKKRKQGSNLRVSKISLGVATSLTVVHTGTTLPSARKGDRQRGGGLKGGWDKREVHRPCSS